MTGTTSSERERSFVNLWAPATLPASPSLNYRATHAIDYRAHAQRKDATISLGGTLWEVPSHLRGLVIAVHFEPVHWSRVEVWLRDQFLGRATRCNKHLNSQIRSSNDYHRFDL
jgi:hypothetical protein